MTILPGVLGEPLASVPLPGRLAGPLHYPSPPSCVWLVAWLLIVAAVAGWLGWRLWRRLQRALAERPRTARRPRPVRRRARPGIALQVAEILERNLDSRSYRRGCHELSGALRGHWEERGLAGPAGPRLTRMTAREIAGRLGERPATRLLALLSELQFGRREPSRRDFEGACELAAEAVAGRNGR